MRALSILAGLALIGPGVARASEGTFEVCAAHDLAHAADYRAEFHQGPILIPAGAVFDYAGINGSGPSDPRHTSAVIVTRAIRLTYRHPCADTTGSVALAPQWGWTVSTIFGDARVQY